MGETARALLIWLPAGTLLPFFISRLTGSDWRGAFLEACLFIALGLLLYPTLLGLIAVGIYGVPNVDILYLIGYALATLTLIGIRRRLAGPRW